MKELIKMSSTIFVTGNIYAIDSWNYFCLKNGNLDLFEKSKLELLTSSSLNIVPLAIFYFQHFIMIIDKNFLFRHLGGILYLFEDKKVRQNWANKTVYFYLALMNMEDILHKSK